MNLPQLPNLPKVGDGGVYRFLAALRDIVSVRFFGRGGKLEKATTFQDLVDMGLVSEDTARRQAEAGGR